MNESLRGDRRNIIFLIFLYSLQAVPVGLAGGMALLLQVRNIGYRSQALFSIVSWPFSLKIIWAPIVDSIFSRRLGRRKSWLIPVQFMIGGFMLLLSMSIVELMEDNLQRSDKASQQHSISLSALHNESNSNANFSISTANDGEDDKNSLSWNTLRFVEENNEEKENSKRKMVLVLTFVFFMLNFLAATQDITVDGWALSMLSRRNIGWASTCNAVGPAIGYSLGNPVFLALESAEFCNKYIRTSPASTGLVTISGYLYFWGVVFVASTVLILLFKKESPSKDIVEDCNVITSVKKTYSQLYSVLKLPSVRDLALIYLTAKLGFSAIDFVTGLKLVDHGLPKEKLALLSVPMIPVQILLPLYISRHTAGPSPMDLYLKAYPYRLSLNFVFIFAVWWTGYLWTPGGQYPNYYYTWMVLIYTLQQIGSYSMAVARTSLNARISDPAIGGSYMSLLTTFSNMGNSWPSIIALYFVDALTFKHCHQQKHCLPDQPCRPVCRTVIDGYTVECILCFILGLLWLKVVHRKITTLQNLPLQSWTFS